jgi:hypothetical protein
MIDQWIDDALVGYSAAEPLAGIEERVLNRIRRRSRIARWAWATPALASLLLAAVIAVRTTPGEQQSLNLSPPSAAPAPTFIPMRPVKRFKIAASKSLTREERALLAFVRRDPAAAVEAFDELQKKSSEPLEIQSIEVQPLQSDGNQ